MALPLIPIILGAAAVGTGGWGIFKGGKAISDNSKANDINERARRLQEYLKQRLADAKDKSARSLERLGNKKLKVWEKPMVRFVDLFQSVKNIELAESTGLDELSKFKIDKQSVVQMREISLLATSFAKGSLGGAVAGGAVAFGAYSAAGAFAAASTGTAIAGLSGAAATNATLAFFGGGALAAGGFGMAGGACVLGGIVAGPALAIMGAVMGAKASANLDNAYSNLSKVQEAESEVNILVTACNGIARRSDMFWQVLVTLEAMFYPQLTKFDEVIKAEGNDYAKYSADGKKNVCAVLSTAQAIKAILDTPLLDEKGSLTKESEDILLATNKFINKDKKADDSAAYAARYPQYAGGRSYPQEDAD